MRSATGPRTALLFGLAFLYAPIVLLVIYSFNASRLVTVWAGASLEWYGRLFRNEALLEAARLSLLIGAVAATLATVLGTLAAVALTRFAGFRGRSLFQAMVLVPIVMPEVMLGIGLLLLFVAIDLPRGFWSITIAHVTFTLCFVTVIVRAGLEALDETLEDAARDLGAGPLRAWVFVVLPALLPSILAGWLLAFTLSFDDLVIASFTGGPGATTLPIRIYGQVRLGVTPEINAAATLLIAMVTTTAVVATLLLRPRR